MPDPIPLVTDEMYPGWETPRGYQSDGEIVFAPAAEYSHLGQSEAMRDPPVHTGPPFVQTEVPALFGTATSRGPQPQRQPGQEGADGSTSTSYISTLDDAERSNSDVSSPTPLLRRVPSNHDFSFQVSLVHHRAKPTRDDPVLTRTQSGTGTRPVKRSLPATEGVEAEEASGRKGKKKKKRQEREEEEERWSSQSERDRRQRDPLASRSSQPAGDDRQRRLERVRQRFDPLGEAASPGNLRYPVSIPPRGVSGSGVSQI